MSSNKSDLNYSLIDYIREGKEDVRSLQFEIDKENCTKQTH